MGIYGGGASIGLPVPAFDLKKIRLTLNSNFLQRMRRGDIVVKPTIKQFDKDKIAFDDDSIENIDTVIACTGYTVQFPFLDFNIVSASKDFDLYHYVFHPDYKNLAFIGLVNVQGPFGPVYEMQARWTARVLSGALTLPDESTMRADISNRHAYLAAHHKRPAIVQYYDYMEQIGRILNVTPKLIKHPRLFKHLLFKPINGLQYRLNGPHAWNGAAEALKSL
jgi:hypothetical protein